MKLRPVEAELFHVGRQSRGRGVGLTGRNELANSRFSQFCEHV